MLNILEIILLVFIAWVVTRQHLGGSGLVPGRERRVILDSCALIDGRIVELVDSGFVTAQLVIPQFILGELQLLADGNDSHKRERARFGLDIAHQLQDTAKAKRPVVIDRSAVAEQATDDKLVALARKLRAQLYTTDYNLAKVAAVQGVSVLNVNDLAQRLRPITLPGEVLTIKILQKGSNRDQGVGYLEDGTMIVIDGGARFVGKSVAVTVTRMHQTVAGKMVFGQVKPGRGDTKDRDDAADSAIPRGPQGQNPDGRGKQSSRHGSGTQRVDHSLDDLSDDARKAASAAASNEIPSAGNNSFAGGSKLPRRMHDRLAKLSRHSPASAASRIRQRRVSL